LQRELVFWRPTVAKYLNTLGTQLPRVYRSNSQLLFIRSHRTKKIRMCLFTGQFPFSFPFTFCAPFYATVLSRKHSPFVSKKNCGFLPHDNTVARPTPLSGPLPFQPQSICQLCFLDDAGVTTVVVNLAHCCPVGSTVIWARSSWPLWHPPLALRSSSAVSETGSRPARVQSCARKCVPLKSTQACLPTRSGRNPALKVEGVIWRSAAVVTQAASTISPVHTIYC